jgi:imidazolonepropionase-like amidohydrolase
MTSKYSLFALVLASVFSSLSAQTGSGDFAIQNATLHLGNGKVIQRGILGVRNGRISEITDLSVPQTTFPDYPTVLEAEGMHVYPGFILMNNTLGLSEVDAVRATLDFRENELFSPEVKAGVAFNAEAVIPGTVRRNGVLFVQSTPRGKFVAGQSSVIALNNKPYTEATVLLSSGLHIYWPSFPSPTVEKEKEPLLAARNERIQKLENLLNAARGSQKSFLQQKVWTALLNGDLPLYIHTDGARETWEALQFSERFSIPKLVLVGALGGEKLIPLLKRLNVGIVMERIYELPPGYSHSLNFRAGLLKKYLDAGLNVVIDYSGDMEAMGSRNLPFTAGYLIGEGLSPETVLTLLTLNPARLLGIDKKLGSLETGKEASFFLSKGNALEITGNEVERAWVSGEEILLETRQEQLYKSFCR